MSLGKAFFWQVEDWAWNLRCRYNFWLHGPYGLAKVVEKMPFRFIIKYLRKYGARVGDGCQFERGLNLHRPFGKKPFENLVLGRNVYIGHNALIDLSRRVEIKDRVIIASRCQFWTHASYYAQEDVDDPGYGENYGQILIEEGALIYSNVVVAHGVKIGKFARVGACAFVNKAVPAGDFVAGVPARSVRPAAEKA